MSEKVTVTTRGFGVWALAFWSFVVIKAAGSSLAAWSWWWVLLPIVPTIWLVLSKLGMLA